MPESFKMKIRRLFFNFFPAYRRTGARITYLADDLSEWKIKLPLNWTTRNYVGTIFGGSMYGALDPIYMVMLIHLLGPDYIVWDKTATIRFLKPGRSTLYATFKLEHEEIDEITNELANGGKIERTYSVDLVDKNGVVHASVEKLIHIRKKE
ncbi:MAG: DUF4442 domain-containing protein [Gemmatimonadota bacterium]|nr:DUF4442 domain-containing protein [Gemmatimonadota bacterium]